MNGKKIQKLLSVLLTLALIVSNIFGYNSVMPVYAGTGDWNSPYTVEEAVLIQNGSSGTVEGYIVGQPTAATSVRTTDFLGDTAIAIADNAGETDQTKMLYIQLSTAADRTAFGLKTNPGNMGMKIKVTGTLTPYFTPHAGIKSITKIEEATGSIEDITAPQITHTPIASAIEGVDIVISAVITDASPISANLYFKKPTDENYSNVAMSAAGSSFTATIPAEYATVSGVAYYIEAVDSFNNISNTEVYVINITTQPASTTIAEARAKAIGETATAKGVVTFIDGSNYYIQDETAAIDIYKSGLPLQIGDLVVVTGAIAEFRGLLEIIPVNVSDVVVISSNNPMPEPKVITIADINDDFEGQIVKIYNVTLGTINTGSNTPITDANGNTINIFKIPALSGINAGDIVDVTAILSQYNTYQLRVKASTDVVKSDLGPDVNAPVINHVPVSNGNTAFDLAIKAQVTDDRQVTEVKLYYRNKSSLVYNSLTMMLNNGEYQGTISKDLLSVEGLEYYIEASDGTNIATMPSDINSPYQVEISNQDITAPIVENLTPANGTSVGGNVRPVISATFKDASAINMTSIKLYLDNTDITAQATITESSITYIPSNDLIDGEHSVSLIIADEFGNTTEKTWSFAVGEEALNIYFGQLHSHTNFSDGQGTPNDAYSWAKNVAGADFFAVTDHSNSLDNDTKNENLTDWRNSTSVEWKQLHEIADSYTDENFVGIAGFEMTWSGSTGGWGHINTFNTEWFTSRNNSAMNLEAYYNKIKGDTASISQLNHPGKTFGDFADFGFYSKEVDNVVQLIEVGNGEGPIRGSGYFPSYEYYTRALDKGWHIAPSNNQDNHKANWVTSNEARTVVLAPSLTRENVYEAIRLMRVYSTEDKNLRISYKVNDQVMGSFLNNPDVLNFSISFEDPDSSDTISKIEIIADGGTIVASKNFSSNKDKWEFTLSPQYNYYYVKITEADKDIAVTAPVWTGEVVPVGIAKVEASQSPTVVNEPVQVSATIFNNGSAPLSNVNVEFYKNSIAPENKIGENMIAYVNNGSSSNAVINWVPNETGNFKIYAQTTISYNGTSKVFTSSTAIDVANKEDIVKVLIDAGHYNQYVSGDYKDKIFAFKGMLQGKNVVVVMNNDELTESDLEGVSILVLTDPQSTDNATYKIYKKVYTNAEVAAIKQYVENGGSIIITSKADYKDATGEYGNAAQGNKVLEAIGTNLRFNDDEIIDNVLNGGQNFRLYFTNYTSTLYNLTSNIPAGEQYSFYSGCSVILKAGGSMSAVDILVKGHSSTETLDSDNQKDNVPVAKGDVIALAAEVLSSGAKIVVAGSTLFSDFEMTGDNAYTNVQMTENIIDWMLQAKPVELKTIADVRVDANEDGIPDLLGKKFAVEGIVTAQSVAVGTNNAFFDVIYVQDETGGITVFGVATKAVPLGTRVRVTGIVDQYDGDAELQVSNEDTGVVILDMNPVYIEPKLMTTGDSMLEENEGWLVKTQGIVTRITENALYINDGTGEARIYVNGYIGDGTSNPEMLGKWDSSIKLGDTVSAVGLASEDPEGHRLRVRNTAEIVKLSTAASGITLDISEAQLEVARSFTLTAQVTPEDASNKNIIWISSDVGIAVVENGVVTGIAEGTAVIKAVAEDGGYTAECAVTVIPVKVTGVIMDKTTEEVKVGKELTLTATVEPLDAKNKDVVWSSSNTAIATVNEGIVVGIAEGTATITVTTIDGAYMAQCILTVTPVAVVGIELDATTLSMNVGDTAQLNATVMPLDATNKAVLWTSSDNSVATVINGIVTAVAPGNAVITASTADGGFTASCNVSISTAAVLSVKETLYPQNKLVVTYMLNGAKDVTAQDVMISYDNSLLELQKVDAARSGISVYEQKGKKAGSVRLLIVSEGASNAFNGDEAVLTLTFKFKNKFEAAEISVDYAVLTNGQGVESNASCMTLTVNTITNKSLQTYSQSVEAPVYTEVSSKGKHKNFDINGDGIISIGDLGIVGYYFGTDKKSSSWSKAQHADVNGNNKIGNEDFVQLTNEILK